MTGESGVKMWGPYEYVAPSYWTTDPQRPAAEQSATKAAAVALTVSTARPAWGRPCRPSRACAGWSRRIISGRSTTYWNFHAGGDEFKNLHVFSEALDKRYGTSTSAEEFTYKSQLMTYEGVRAMYEAYSRNKYTRPA